MTTDTPSEPRSIAVAHLNQVGDLMFSLPVLASLRQAYPRARLFSIVKESLEPLLVTSGLVDGVLTHRGWRDFFAAVGRLRAASPDLVVCLSQAARTRVLALASGAGRRVGFGEGPMAVLLTESIDKPGIPSTANNLRLLRAHGWPTPYETYRGLFSATADDRAAALALLEAAGWDGRATLIAASLGASANRREKEWPGERLMEVAHRSAGQGACTVIVGAEAAHGVEHDPAGGVIDLTRRTDLRQLMGVLDLASLFVGVDSGVLHLAAALGKPAVALFGPTVPEVTGPQGGGHLVVRASEDGPGPMETISADRVAEAVEEVLGRQASVPGSDRLDGDE